MIIYACSDLIFATKIRSTAESLKLPSRPVRDAQMLGNRLSCVDDGKLNEPVSGLLIDLDLGQAGLDMIDQVRKHEAASGGKVAVLTFGSHVATEILAQARERGADFVMSRGQFTSNLPEILQRMAKVG